MCDQVIGAPTAVDAWALCAAIGHRSTAATAVAQTWAWAGSSPIVWAAVVLVAVVVAGRVRAVVDLLVAGAATGVALAATVVLKEMVRRPRPPLAAALVHAGGWSMPSTATTTVAAPSVVLVALLVGRLRAGPRAVAVLGVVARDVALGAVLVCLGAHWATDVVAGWVVGLVVGGSATVALRLGRRTG